MFFLFVALLLLNACSYFDEEEIKLPGKRVDVFEKKSQKLIKSNKFDIVHSHLPHMEFLMFFVLIFNKYNFKYFITKHVDNNFLGGSRYPSNNFIVHLIDFILTYKANKIICISKAVKNYYLNKILSKNSKKYKIIYYGINKQYKSELNYKSKIKNIPICWKCNY